MTNEKLKYANELNDCLDQLKNLKEQFEKECPSVNQTTSTRLTPEILETWKEANLTVLDECIEQVEQEFESL